MLVKRISTQQARASFSEILGSVYYTKNPVIVERKGKPMAVLISPEQYASLEKELSDLWTTVDGIRLRNQDLNPDQILDDVTREVEVVRQAHYAKTKKTSKSSH